MDYIRDGQGSIVSYYVLTKTHGGKALFDPEDPSDTKYYAAVATQFQEFRPRIHTDRYSAMYRCRP